MDGEFVNLTPEDIGSEHLCCVIRSKTAHPGVEAKRAWLAAQFVHVDTLEKAKSLPCAFINRAVFYSGTFVTVRSTPPRSKSSGRRRPKKTVPEQHTKGPFSKVQTVRKILHHSPFSRSTVAASADAEAGNTIMDVIHITINSPRQNFFHRIRKCASPHIRPPLQIQICPCR